MEINNQNKSKIEIIISMLIFGSVGIFVHYIDLPSSMISVARGVLGFLVLLLYAFVSGKNISLNDVKNNIFLLFVSGTFIGFNWVFLFESYRYTTVAVSTLCYYMAPVFFIILSLFFLKEKVSQKKIICVAVSLLGMVLISGIFKSDFSIKEIKGVLFALCAALMYSFVTLFNKKFKSISPNDKTVVQLFFAAAVILPYSLVKKELDFSGVSLLQIVLLIIVGVIHTGFSYVMFFGAIKKLPAQTTAVLSYIDPITAVILSALILKEKLDLMTVTGAVLIIGASVISEI
ncbi:MAG: EamA family transporter, partial [Clostridia bacterium]|nr:EamA family transporter [Clostridia bacterium]